MSCSAWNEQWVAKLYGELAPDEERRLEEHLAGCESCRDTLEELGRARLLLREGVPVVPSAPRTVVLRPGRFGRPAWAFAAGLAAALVVFGIGAWAGVTALGDAGRPGDDVRAQLARDATDRDALERRIASLEADLAKRGPQTPGDAQAMVPAAQCVTPKQLDAGLNQLAEQVKYDRYNDMEYVLGQMHAVERRAAGWVDETREAVRLVALTSDPHLNER